jgi:hypothetical protein
VTICIFLRHQVQWGGGWIKLPVHMYGYNVQTHVSLTSVIIGGEWSASHPGHFNPFTHWTGGCVGPRTGRDDVESRKILPILGLELQPFGRPARSQSLYRLSYPGSKQKQTIKYVKNAVFWDVALCRCCVNRRFGGTYRLHLRDRKISERGTRVNR